MRDAEFQDEIGRKYLVRVPEGVSDADIDLGTVIGPPHLDALGLPEATMVRLHNQLYARRLLTERDVRMRLEEVVASLQAALAVDAQTIHALFVTAGTDQMPERVAPQELPAPEDIYGAWNRGPSEPSKQAQRNPSSDDSPAVQEHRPIARRR